MGNRIVKVNVRARRIIRCTAGASAAEFALILPVLLLMLFGTLQVSLMMYSFNSMAGAARDATRTMSVCTVSDPAVAKTQAIKELPAWVPEADWDIQSVIGDDVSMTIAVNTAEASIITLVPFMPPKLITTVTMRREPLAYSGGLC